VGPRFCSRRGPAPAAVPVPGPEQLFGAARRWRGLGRARGERRRGQGRRLLLLRRRLLHAQGPASPRGPRLCLPAVHPQRRALPVPISRPIFSSSKW
jgi:hypothetical protein